MEKNRDMIRYLIEAFNRRDVATAAGLIAEDLVNHCALPGAQGRAGLFKLWDHVWTAFPDLAWTIEDMIAEGDRVVCRVRMRGVHSGPLRFALMPLPPTGRAFEAEAIHIFRVDEGKVVEDWSLRDEVGLLRQLGFLSIPQR